MFPATGTGPLVSIGALTTVAPAGGQPVAAAVADDGAVAYGTADAVYLATGGAPQPVATRADGRYRGFGGLDLADGGALLFCASLDPSGEGIFLHMPQATLPIAVSGDASPAGSPYVSFSQPTIIDRHTLAFRAVLADGRVCVVQQADGWPPVITLASGLSFPDGVVTGLSISRLGLALCCVATMADGHRTALIVNDATVASGDWLREGDGGIDRVLDPPAISAQLGFVTVRRDDGGSALWTRPPGVVDPTAVVATGDPVPGSAAGAIDQIGPPIASNCATLRIPFGVAAPVRHADGRHAIWLGVFTSQLPLAGIAVTPVAEGTRTDDDHEVAGPLTPLSLSNNGVLLFRDQDTLLRLDGLFQPASP